jgi:hypothetical protein
MTLSTQNEEKAHSLATFSREQLQTDICNILLMEARKHNQLFDHTLNMKAIRLEEISQMGFWDYSLNATELEMSFSNVKNTEFAKAMFDNYDFGFHAITGTRTEPMDCDSLHTWFGAYLLSLNGSPYVEENEGWGNFDLKEAVRRCLCTMELSNARLVLEGNEPFYHFSRSDKKDDDIATEGELTIRQLAMLAGMEEMSLRSIISRKTEPVLEIRKQDRRTIIDANVAAEWLKAKGRYLPVTRGRRTAGLDLSVTQFRDINDLQYSLQDRQNLLEDRTPGATVRLNEALKVHGKQSLDEIRLDDFANQNLMTEIAKGLELPPHWLILRAAEAKLKTEIFLRSYELEQVKVSLKEAAAKEAATMQSSGGENS